MAYIGKDPAQVKRALNEKDTFTGDGSTVAFDLTSDASSANEIQVFVDNIRQEPGASDAYTLGEDGSGNLRRITFTAAPDSGAEIYVLNPKTTDSNLIVPSDNSVTSAKIVDGTIVNADINACAAISDTKLGTISTSGKVATSAISQPGSSSVYLAGDGSWGAIDTTQQDTNAFNISLLGFKMAVNEGLTVFNLVDGVVDEFNDESGTDEAEGSNDLYCAASDYYINSTSPTGATVPGKSAGFTTSSITEPDTSTTGTNPSYGSGTFGQYSVSTSSVNIFAWGAGGARGKDNTNPCSALLGGGGGFAKGTLATSPGQTLYVSAGEGGVSHQSPDGSPGFPRPIAFLNGGTAAEPGCNAPGYGADAGGLAGVFAADLVPLSIPQYSAPQAYVVAGSGGGGGYRPLPVATNSAGAGGGLIGDAGGQTGNLEQTSNNGSSGGGGSQTVGGQAGAGVSPFPGQGGVVAGLFLGGRIQNSNDGGGGAGYYGGGASHNDGTNRGGGGGSSYYGQPQITCGSTEEGTGYLGGGTADPNYVAGTNEGSAGGTPNPSTGNNGEDGYILITTCAVCASTTATTIVSTAFTSTSVPTSARIVVFEENVDTPTLNTDVIASISRDGGTTFTNATLTDSGYVTGSSGQRILTGQATISGQPSGQSMRWKLALANNTVKIHGVSLQWA